MTRFHKLVARAKNDDGVSLIELIVALMVFSIIALGVGYSTLTIIKMTADTRNRQIATNLATAEIDEARSFKDPFDVVNDDDPGSTVKVGKTTFLIVRTTEWVDTTGADVACGTGTGTMQAKRVNVTVTWDGMLTTTKPVRTDTLISPDTRINDPNLGTIRVSVLGFSGKGSDGVAVTITPTSGQAALSVPPEPTNTDGCSFALKVLPGTYKVAISRTNSIDVTQNVAPTLSVTVTAGGSVAAPFTYDYATQFNLTYANGTAKLPDNLQTTYVSTYGLYLDTGRKSQINLHPFSSGYTGIAGKFVVPIDTPPKKPGCLSVDPGAWQSATVNGVALAQGVRPEPVGEEPGKSVAMNIPMGVVTVTLTGTVTLTAESATAPASAADPGCGVPMSYSFGSVNGTQTIALPYGSWTLYQTVAGLKTAIPGTKVGLIPGLLGTLLGTNSNVITLDPRRPA